MKTGIFLIVLGSIGFAAGAFGGPVAFEVVKFFYSAFGVVLMFVVGVMLILLDKQS